MRKKIVAGNWKMNKTLQDAVELTTQITTNLSVNPVEGVDVILTPPFLYLSDLQKITHGQDGITLAAQNCSDKNDGAYTGEVSAEMINSVGANSVIIGHSERREYFSETNQLLAAKVDQAITHQLQPVYCCGEVLEERKSGNYESVIAQQIEEGLFHLSADQMLTVVIAYEPVWAIGTGETASPEQAQEVHQLIRKQIGEKYGAEIADQISILYGGSVKPGNAKELFAQADIDGGLIGGASLKADDFTAIITSF